MTAIVQLTHPDLVTHDALGLATQAELDAHAATPHGGTGSHPDLATHDTLGLATDAELAAHAATPHGGTHPDLAAHDTLGLATDAELSSHAGASTGVHGVGASTVESVAGAQAKVDTHAAGLDPHPVYATDADLATHAADSTAVHGITDTAALVVTTDSRLSDARAPTGAAGGVLGGTYPSPAFAVDMATQAELDTHAGAADPHTGYARKAAANTFTVGGHTIEAEGTAVVPLAIKGRPTGQTGNLQQWENPGNNNVTRVKASGAFEAKNVADGGGIGANGLIIDNTGIVNQGAGVQMAAYPMVISQAWQFFAKASGDNDFVVGRAGMRDNMILGAADAKVYFPGPNSGTTIPAGNFSLLAAAGNNASFVPIIAKAAASQTANRQEWQDSAGTVDARITSAGSIDTTKGLAVGVATKTAAYTATRDDFLVLADATGGTFTVTLPPASNRGQIVVVKKTDSGLNAVTVSRAGTDTIQGATTRSLSTQYDFTFLIADGTSKWMQLGGVSA